MKIEININPIGEIDLITIGLKPGEALDFIRQAFLKLAKETIATHKCPYPDCIRIQESLLYVTAMEAIDYQMRGLKGQADINLKEVFVVARTDDGGIDMISIYDMLKANRFDELSQWFSIKCNELVGIREGDRVRTSQYQNMVRFLKKNGAGLIDLENVNAQKDKCETEK